MPHEGRLNTSTPSIGVSTLLLFGTPSFFRRSKKLWFSPTTIVHSAKARPQYLACDLLSPVGSTGTFSRRSSEYACSRKKFSAGRGSLGGYSLIGPGTGLELVWKSRLNLKLKFR